MPEQEFKYGEITPSRLAPRVRETLSGLLEGLSEKQVAQKLAISTNTVHTYVKQLYSRFRVNSRCELLSLWIDRRIGHRLDQSFETQKISLPALRKARLRLSANLAKLDQQIAAKQAETARLNAIGTIEIG